MARAVRLQSILGGCTDRLQVLLGRHSSWKMAGQIVRQVDDSIVKSAQTSHHNDDSASTEVSMAILAIGRIVIKYSSTGHFAIGMSRAIARGERAVEADQAAELSLIGSHLAARQERIPALLLRLHDDMAADNQVPLHMLAFD
eukprot:765942-Hanusia_phi.AAC.7